MSQLSDALHSANREDLSYREIQRRAERHGERVSTATISSYMTGSHSSTPSPKVLRAFAAAFGVSVETLTSDAGLPAVGSRFELPAEADILDGQERRVVVDLIRTMASMKRAAAPQQRPAPKTTATIHQLHPERDHLDVAAYEGADEAWLRRREADAARGEESQESPYDD
ncbi:MAG: helix-turn-helix domain-containing protein [Actinomycetia bacterium]|nr:helix-turn-helix domain-containing protein [Actinomycetes bacterium]